MGFFSDLKDDLSQAVNELMPEEEGMMEEGVQAEAVQEETAQEEAIQEEMPAVEETMAEELAVEEIQEVEEEAEVVEEMASETVNGFDADLGKMLDTAEEMPVEEEIYVAPAAAPQKIDSVMTSSKQPCDEVSVITESMIINGNLATEGALDIRGSIVGNIEALGKLNITGVIQGNSQAAEIYAESARITGELRSNGSVKVGQSTVIIGNIFANSAVIAGAVKGDIDVRGPVILDSSAIVMGDIKSKSVQINNGAVIEGMCSQCYAEVNPTSFFEELKKMK